jgi:hypothetical protein
MKSKTRIWFSGGMIILLLFVMLPGEYFHLLAGHESTCCSNYDGVASIENHHHYCELQKFKVQTYLASTDHISLSVADHFYQAPQYFYIHPSIFFTPLFHLRAPPFTA